MVNDCVGAGTGGWGRRRSSRFVFTCSAWTRAGSATRRRPAAVSREERRNMVDWVVVSVVGVVGGDDGERGVQLCVPPRWQSVVWSANALLPPPWSACAQGGGGGGGKRWHDAAKGARAKVGVCVCALRRWWWRRWWWSKGWPVKSVPPGWCFVPSQGRGGESPWAHTRPISLQQALPQSRHSFLFLQAMPGRDVG